MAHMGVDASADHYEHRKLLDVDRRLTRVPSSYLLSCNTAHGLARGAGKRA